MTDRVRVLIADDHPVFRSGLRALLATDPALKVVGEAATGLEAVATTASEMPDVVLMDLNMPEVDGVAATGQILQANPGVAVLVLTMFDDDDSVFAAMRAGARGYLLKGTNQADILRAVHAVAIGGAVFGPAVAHRVLDFFAHGAAQSKATFPQLSEREREVLDLLAQGDSNSQIATKLTISEKTVRNHVSNIFAKLALADRAQAIVRARDAGLGRHPPYQR
jgi:DNA-binding NarL/FixJ family response regulator